MTSTFQNVAYRWWVGDEWRYEIDFNDQILSTVLRNDGRLTNDVAQKIANKYSTARQFPKFADKSKKPKPANEYSPAVKLLNDMLSDLTAGNLVRHVSHVANELALLRVVAKGKKFEVVRNGSKGKHFTTAGRVPLSAVSKWTWFARPDVGVIYDEQARLALQKCGRVLRQGDYQAYVTAFEDLYRDRRDRLERALDSLGGEKPTETWATRKLLDLWLWDNGPKGKGASSPRRKC